MRFKRMTSIIVVKLVPMAMPMAVAVDIPAVGATPSQFLC
jgi:hypothetical protein